jgi:hypothetical protein
MILLGRQQPSDCREQVFGHRDYDLAGGGFDARLVFRDLLLFR